MATKTSSSSSGGIGFMGVLQILFIAFKLLGVIDWSWWWVMAPTWITLAVIVVVVLGFIVISVAIQYWRETRRSVRR
jgi:membrane protein YdbS with pleckstrin-like domain